MPCIIQFCIESRAQRRYHYILSIVLVYVYTRSVLVMLNGRQNVSNFSYRDNCMSAVLCGHIMLVYV